MFLCYKNKGILFKMGGTLSSGQQLTSANKLQGGNMVCLGLKNQVGQPNTWTTAYTHNVSGILRKLWVATDGSYGPGNIYIQIIADGNVVWGNTNRSSGQDGIGNIGLALDMLMAPAGAGTASFETNILGCNMFNPTGGFGGYIVMDIAFINTLQILLGTSQSSTFNYWIQPFVEEFPQNIVSLYPYKCYCIPVKWSNTIYNNEYPLLDFKGNGNGVHLLGIKMYIFGLSGAWWEGRFRAYTSTNGFGKNSIPATGWNINHTISNIPTGMTGGRVILQSTGTEDFFFSSHNWTNTKGVYATDTAGCLYNSNGTNGVVSNSSVSVYRFFDQDRLHSNLNDFLSLTWTSGDPQVGESGSVTIFSQVWFLA